MRLLLAGILVIFSLSLRGEESGCPHGELSQQFCDRDGDMMADAPGEPERWLDPYTLIFGNTPKQSFIFSKGAQKALMAHIEKVTGKHVISFPYQTNSAELEAMRSGMLHIAGMNTGSVPTAVNCAGFHLFAMTAKNDGTYGYTMQMITYPGSGIKSIYDIRDKTVLFTNSSSNSGHKAPVALLKERFEMQDGIHYQSRFSGNHNNSIKKIAQKKYKAAFVASGFTQAMKEQQVVPKNAFQVIYESDSFPTTGYGYSHRLKPELAKKIEKAFLTFIWKETDQSPAKSFNKFGENRFIPADYKEKWKIIRDIDKANHITYDCK
jgi:phosphonate transport system substrate-binding protein